MRRRNPSVGPINLRRQLTGSLNLHWVASCSVRGKEGFIKGDYPQSVFSKYRGFTWSLGKLRQAAGLTEIRGIVPEPPLLPKKKGLI